MEQFHDVISFEQPQENRQACRDERPLVDAADRIQDLLSGLLNQPGPGFGTRLEDTPRKLCNCLLTRDPLAEKNVYPQASVDTTESRAIRVGATQDLG